MKQSFDNNKNSNRSKISKKWIYAAAVTGVLITGAKAAQNTDNGSIDAKAATAKKATSVQVYVIDDRGIQVYPNGLKLTVNGKGKFDLSTLYTSLTGGITQYDASEVKAAMNNNTVDGSQSSYTFHVKNLTNPVASSSASQQSSAAQQSSSASESSASNDSSAQSSNASQSSNGSSSVDSSSAAQSSASDSNNGSSSANNSSSAQGSTSNSGSSNSTSSNDANATKTVKVVVYNAMNPSDYVPFDVTVPYDSTVLDLKKIPYPNQNSGNSSIYDFMISNWGVDPESISTNPTIEDDGNGNYSARFSDYHIKTDKTFNFVDSNQNVAYSKTIQANNDAPYDISDVLNSVPSYLVLDPTNDMVKTHSFRAQESAPETYTINVNYQKTLSIDDDNNNPTGMKARFTSNSSTLTADQFKARLAGQGFQVVNPNDLPDPINFANSDSYAIKLIKNSLPISFVDQHGNVVYSTNLPSSAINQPVSIKDVLNTVTKKGVTPDSSNSIVSNQAVPAFYKDQSVKINVTAPVSNLTINFVDKSTGKVVDSLQKDNVTDFDNISIADKVNSLKSQNYAPELSSLSSQFNSQTYDNFQAQYVLNPAIKDEGNGNHVATIYVDSTVATPANTNKTGEGYAMKFKDANGNPIALTVNSASPKIAPKELQKALADQGYTLSQDDINKLGDTPVDLTENNGDTGLTIAPNANSNSVYPKTVSFVDADGKTKTAIVNIKSDNPSMDTNALAKALADQGYTLTDAEKAKLGQNTDLSSTDPIAVTPNADASTTKSYPQSLTYTDGNGQTHDVSVSINSKTPTMSKDNYIKALEDKGYKLTDDQKNKLSDSVDLSAITTPLVIANPNAPTSYQQTVVLPDGTKAKVNINSKSSTIDKDDLAKELAAQGYALPNNAGVTYPLDLTKDNSINVKPNAQAVTNYPQTVKVANEDGTFTNKTVFVPSANGTLSASEYVKAMLDNGYTVANPSGLIDPLSVAFDNVNPVVIPNASAHAVKLNVKQNDGTTKEITVNVGSQNSYLNKSDFVNAVSAQGYTIADMDSLPSSIDLSNGKAYDATPNASSYTNTLNSSDGTKSAVVKHDTPLITKQDLIKQLKDQGLNVSDTGKLNDVLNLTNSDDMKNVASLIEGFKTYKINVGVVGTGDTISVSGNSKTISKQDFINRVEADGYKLMNPDALNDTLDLTNPDDFKGLIIAKAGNVEGNRDESNTSYSQDAKIAGSNDTVKVESQNKTMTKDEFVKYLDANGYKVADESKLPETIDLTKPLSDIELVSNKDQSSSNNDADKNQASNDNDADKGQESITYGQNFKVAGSNDIIKVESQNETMTKDEFVKYLNDKGYKVADESKLPETIDLTEPLSDIELVSDKNQASSNNDADKNQASSNNDADKNQASNNSDADKNQASSNNDADKKQASNNNDADKNQAAQTYAQDVKVAGSNDVVKVESANKTMTKDEFVKELDDKGYKVADESKLPETIDLTKPVSDIEAVSNNTQSSSNNDADKNQASNKTDVDNNQASSKTDAYKNQANKVYVQNVKVAGSNKTIKVESSKNTMTKAEFVKYLASKGYKVADESQLPSTIDLTKSLGDIKVVAKKAASKKTIKKSNKETEKNASAKEVNGHRGQFADKKEAGKLPQTGDETNQRNLFGFGLISMVLGFILAIFGLRRKNK
ncbi:LPXTG cell wall anchor domain-containing protein [Apilactobacillus kunkeei]|uniref:LPXTG cell wall anchor domain-containing protein n=1 Tax=Apilactobacillus kunkeei TaxID=148814 RepID=UPI0039DF8997